MQGFVRQSTVAALVAVGIFAGGLAQAADTASAPSRINAQRQLDDFFGMVKLRSQTKNERAFADTLKARLAALGAEVSEDEAYKAFGGNTGNIFAFFKGSVKGAPVMLLNAHIDTVEPSEGIEPKVVDGVIRPAGKTILGGDDKAGVSAVMEALTVMQEKKIPHADLLVVLTVGEESGMLGSKNIDQKMIRKADFGISLDGSSATGEIVLNAPGANIFKIEIEGKAAHAGRAPEKGINAITLASKAIATLRQGRLDEESTANVGTIQCGVSTNVVPERCSLTAEARSLKVDKLEAQTNYMTDTFVQVAQAGGGKATVTVVPVIRAYKLETNALPVVVMSNTIKRMGGVPRYIAPGGGTDANFFNEYGIPTAMVAVGGGANHTTDEYISVAELHKAADMALTLIEEAAKLRK